MQSVSTVGHPSLGSARRYVFRGGSLPQCAVRCVMYQLEDGDGGYAVLAGGGPDRQVDAVSEKAGLGLSPSDY